MIGRLVLRFPVLRNQLKAIRMDQSELARSINRSRVYVASRMTGRGSFTLDECYVIRAATGLTGLTIEEVFHILIDFIPGDLVISDRYGPGVVTAYSKAKPEAILVHYGPDLTDCAYDALTGRRLSRFGSDTITHQEAKP